MPDAAGALSLVEQLEDLDRGVFDSVLDPSSFAAPPPLLHRLFVPQPGRLWRQMDQSDHSGYLIPDALSDEKLQELDRGLVQVPGTFERRGPSREVVQQRSPGSVSSGAISGWTVSAWLVLLMFAGAAGAALVFHDRLSVAIVQWEARPR